MDCIFCKIINNELPSEKVYEDDIFAAILDVNPVKPGHTLVMPKDHVANFDQASEKTISDIMPVIQKLARAVVAATDANGFNVVTNNGKAAHQSVEHLHFHIIPRHENDGLQAWPQGSYQGGEANQLAKVIRENV